MPPGVRSGVAQSLLSGQFQPLFLFDGDSSGLNDSMAAGKAALARTRVLDTAPGFQDSQGIPSLLAPKTAVGQVSDTHLERGGYALPGQSETSSRISGRKIYWQSVARIGLHAAQALEHAHEHGIVHRDVKPGNLLLDTTGTVWVTDFGLAKSTDQQDLTHTGDVLGTLRYMAPEQFEGKADSRSDLYSLGLTLYEMLALQLAFDGQRVGGGL